MYWCTDLVPQSLGDWETMSVKEGEQFLSDCFLEGASLLGYVCDSRDKQGFATLIWDAESNLRLERSPRYATINNVLDASNCHGSGTITPGQELLPIMLMYLKHKVELVTNAQLWLSFADSESAPINSDTTSELITCLQREGFNETKLRQYAEAMGLCAPLLDLSLSDTVEDGFYF